MNFEVLVKNIRQELKNKIVTDGLKALVIGESGGIDSALCTVLAKPVCDELGIKLIGRSIPIETNKQDEIDRAKSIGELFCTDFKVKDLTQAYINLETALIFDNEFNELMNEIDFKISKGNTKARIRMIYLFKLAHAHKGMVLSTDNFTELLLGFWTLHGDVGNYGMIQNFWKTEVYNISKWLVENELDTIEKKKALNDCIICNPTDGLGITNSDLDQLGVKSYDEVDKILKIWLTDDVDAFHYDEKLKYEGRPTDYNEFVKIYDKLVNERNTNPIIVRHLKSEFKRNDPFNIDRLTVLCDDDLVDFN